jgi:hypothetical protein
MAYRRTKRQFAAWAPAPPLTAIFSALAQRLAALAEERAKPWW